MQMQIVLVEIQEVLEGVLLLQVVQEQEIHLLLVHLKEIMVGQVLLVHLMQQVAEVEQLALVVILQDQGQVEQAVLEQEFQRLLVVMVYLVVHLDIIQVVAVEVEDTLHQQTELVI